MNVTETIRAGIAISADPAPVEIDPATLSVDERVVLPLRCPGCQRTGWHRAPAAPPPARPRPDAPAA